LSGEAEGAKVACVIEVARISQFMATESVPPGRVLARIAAGQHGVVSRQQLVALGYDAEFAHRSLQSGRLHRIHQAVFAVGHAAIPARGRWMAAVLACGETSLLSHISAALLWELIDRSSSLIHVLVPGRGSRSRPGIVIHRTRRIPDEHRTERDGIPVTTPARTLLDLAGLLPPERLRFAVEAADRRRLLDIHALVALCGEFRGRRGVAALRRLALEQRGAVHRTKSPPEARFLRLCLRHGLPEPLVNTRLHGYEVDFHWPEARLVVEIDSYTYHRSWAQRRRDLRRDADLKARGVEVLRLTPEMVAVPETFALLESMFDEAAAAAV
jgi:hypothetical protein